MPRATDAVVISVRNKSMKKSMSLIIGLCLLTAASTLAQEESDESVEARMAVHTRLQQLLSIRGDSGTMKSINKIDTEIVGLATEHGRPLLISVLKDIASGECLYRREACNVLEQHIARNEFVTFLKNLQTDLEKEAELVSERLRILTRQNHLVSERLRILTRQNQKER